MFKNFQLLTVKPICYVCNIGENEVCMGGNELSKAVIENKGEENCVVLSAKIESEVKNYYYYLFFYLFYFFIIYFIYYFFIYFFIFNFFLYFIFRLQI